MLILSRAACGRFGEVFNDDQKQRDGLPSSVLALVRMDFDARISVCRAALLLAGSCLCPRMSISSI
jgi:hypothetical protein